MSSIKKALFVIIFTIVLIFIGTKITNAKTVEITTETLNLRKEATTDSDIVALISIGDECEVLADDGDWYKVKYGEYTGYISKEYTKVIGEDVDNTENDKKTSDNESTDSKNTSSENDTDKEINTQPQDNNNQTGESQNNSDDTKTENSQDVNNLSQLGKLKKDEKLRITPLIGSSSIENIKKDQEVTIITELGGWTYIQTDLSSGWIRTDSILKSTSSVNDKTENDNSNVNNIDNEAVKDNEKEESKTDNESTNFTKKTMYVKEEIINIRKEANTSAEIVMVVSQNTELDVIGESGDWYKVDTSSGEAYVLKELLSDKKVSVTNRGSVDRTKDKNNNEEAEDRNTSTSNSSKEDDNSVTGNQIVSYAKKFLGVPYVYGGASPSGFDCSGFTMYVYEHFEISMPHGAQSQSKRGKNISANKDSKSSLLNNLKPGDLVFFLDYETMDEIGHCGIYIGEGNFIHASSGSGYCVKINSLLPGEYYNTRYCAARRIV